MTMEPTREGSLLGSQTIVMILPCIHKPDPKRHISPWQDTVRLEHPWRLETQRFVANPAAITELLDSYLEDFVPP